VLTVRTEVRGAGYSEDERLALYRRLVESLQAIPGVESVSMSANGPMWGSQRISSLSVEGYSAGRDEQLRTNEEIVTDRYFDTMGLKVLDGRSFRPEDRAPGARNTVVNATMARRFFPNQSAVGKRWDYGDSIGKNSNMIVGVVEDAKYVDVKVAPPNMAYTLAERRARASHTRALDVVIRRADVKPSVLPWL
jgi:putative ABC transport system permease protein